MKIAIPLKMKVRGTISLGPRPGTPEFEQEQRERAARLQRVFEDDNEATAPVPRGE